MQKAQLFYLVDTPYTFGVLPSKVYQTNTSYKLQKRDNTVAVLTTKEGAKWTLINSKECDNIIYTLLC